MALIRTNIVLDTKKLSQAKKVTGLKTTKEVVDFALKRLTDSAKALDSLAHLAGKIHFKKGYSYKKQR